MQKIIIIICIIIIVIIAVYDINNTPTSKVEEYLTKYQMLDKDIYTSYKLLNNDNLSNKEQKEYENIIKKQYRNLVYEIKDEKIDSNIAIVKAKIEVFNYKKITSDIEDLKNNKERITYTISFKVIKDKNKWELTEIKNEDKQKLLGIY